MTDRSLIKFGNVLQNTLTIFQLKVYNLTKYGCSIISHNIIYCIIIVFSHALKMYLHWQLVGVRLIFDIFCLTGSVLKNHPLAKFRGQK